jgi:hypothetical protein
MRYRAIKRPWLVLIVFALAGLLSQPAAAYPLAGFDEFDSNAQVTLNLTKPPLGTIGPITLVGPARIRRGNPYIDGGLRTIDTEIVSMELRGIDPFDQPVSVTLNPALPSTGQIQAQAPNTDFPADSFFDVFVEIQTAAGTFHNGPNDPMRMESVIRGRRAGGYDHPRRPPGGSAPVVLRGARWTVLPRLGRHLRPTDRPADSRGASGAWPGPVL